MATIAAIIVIHYAIDSVTMITMLLACYNYPPLNRDTVIPTFTIKFSLEYIGRSSLILIANSY
jgi:hypothetical protein